MPTSDTLARLPDRRGWTLKDILTATAGFIGIAAFILTVYLNVRSEAKMDGSLEGKVSGAMAIAKEAKSDVVLLKAETDRKFEILMNNINANQLVLIDKVDGLKNKFIDHIDKGK